MKRVLVTGGLGFIGSNFVRHLLKRDDVIVTNLDKQTYSGNPENLRDIEDNPRYRWVKGDVADPATVAALMAETDIVVHFAAETHVDRSILDPEAFLRTNINGTYVLLEEARKNGIERFVHVSTDEVYGSVETGESVEGDPLAPNSPYSASKASSDLLVRSYNITFGLPTVTTRCSNNFGPYQFPEKALPLLITNATHDVHFPLYGTGVNVRDWIYVQDHVEAIEFLMDNGALGETYNIGGTCEIENKELFTRILDAMGKPASLLRQVDDRPGHDKRYALNCEKIKALGWQPRYTFDSALADTIAWYQNNPQWWLPLKGDDTFKQYYDKQYVKR